MLHKRQIFLFRFILFSLNWDNQGGAKLLNCVHISGCCPKCARWTMHRVQLVLPLDWILPKEVEACKVLTCIDPEMLSLSLRISWRFFVPKMFRRVVCASNLKEELRNRERMWLKCLCTCNSVWPKTPIRFLSQNKGWQVVLGGGGGEFQPLRFVWDILDRPDKSLQAWSSNLWHECFKEFLQTSIHPDKRPVCPDFIEFPTFRG